MHVNRTGSGFHADSRREVRASKAAARQLAIAESVAGEAEPCPTTSPTEPCEQVSQPTP